MLEIDRKREITGLERVASYQQAMSCNRWTCERTANEQRMTHEWSVLEQLLSVIHRGR